MANPGMLVARVVVKVIIVSGVHNLNNLIKKKKNRIGICGTYSYTYLFT